MMVTETPLKEKSIFLHRLYLNLRCKEARRDIADPYQMHSTLCRAFSPPDQKCPAGEYLWRLESEVDEKGNPRLLIQSRSKPNWSSIGVEDWLAGEPDPAIDLADRLGLAALSPGKRFRYRLKANPSKTDIRNGKRLGLFKQEDQVAWLARKGGQHGFSTVSAHLSQEGMLRGNRNNGGVIRVFSVLFDGLLEVKDPVKFREALGNGIGHGKTMGLGLLSVVPMA